MIPFSAAAIGNEFLLFGMAKEHIVTLYYFNTATQQYQMVDSNSELVKKSGTKTCTPAYQITVN